MMSRKDSTGGKICPAIKSAFLCLTFGLTLLLVSCHRVVKESYPSGKPMYEKTYKGKKLDGVFRMWFETGSIQQQAIYRNDKLHGTMTRWYANGNKEIEDQYINGLKNGKSVSWDVTGNKVEERNYRNDTLDGEYRLWYDSGVPKIEGAYLMGLYHGKWLYFSETGTNVGEGNFIQGSGELIGFDAMGRRNHVVNFLKSRKHGSEILYNPDGSIEETKVYDQDKLIKVIKSK